MEYWCRLFDLGGRAIGAEKLEAAHDQAAINRARVIYQTGLLSSFELWHNDRLVHRQEIN